MIGSESAGSETESDTEILPKDGNDPLTQAAANVMAMDEGATRGKQSRNEKKARKAISKLGLKLVTCLGKNFVL